MINKYEESDYQDMREFYFQILYESRHFLPYSTTLNQGFFNSPERLNYIIRDEKIIAHLTLSKVNDDVYSIGIAVLKEHYGKGLGGQMLDYAEQTLKEIGVKKIIASIHTDNWRSILLFIKHGYTVVNEDRNLCLEKVL